MTMKHACLTLLLGLSVSYLPAQIGGRHVYDFMNLTPSARILSLGGVNVATMDEDVNFALQNPALASSEMHRRVALSFSSYLAGIRYGYAGYSHTFDQVGTFHTGIHYMNSGEMQGADEYGNLTNPFYANELLWVVGYANAYKGFRYGGNLKVISSTLAPGFHSAGLALDLAGAYRGPEKLFSAGLVLRNMGAQLSTYVPGAGREPLPFEIVAGVSNKLRYMPMRFSITATNLEHPRLLFIDPDAPPELDLAGNVVPQGSRIPDQIFRHFVFSTEFLLGEFLRLRAGYNHLRRQELAPENRGGLTGFSLGAGIRTRRFALDYGFASFGFGNAFQVNQVSLLVNLEPAQVAGSAPDPGL